MLKNSLKVVFLGVVGFFILVYLTAPKNQGQSSINNNLVIKTLLPYVELVGEKRAILTKEILKNKEYIIVLNHDSLMVFKDLDKYTNKDILLVANISNTPWLIKKLAVDSELEKMYKKSKLSLVNDSKGSFVSALGLSDDSQNAYFIYKIDKENIKNISKGYVKKGALQDGVSKEDIKISLEKIIKEFK